MKIKYLPTGNVFDLPVEECKRIYKESPFNYEILDEHFDKEAATPKSTVAQKVLEEDGEEELKTLNDLTVPELKAICDEREIEYSKADRKADLIALIEKADNDEQDAEEEEEEQEEEDGEEEETEDGELDGSDEEETEEESEE